MLGVCVRFLCGCCFLFFLLFFKKILLLYFFCGVLGVGGGKIYLFSHWISLLTLMKRRKENNQWHKLGVLFKVIWRRTYGMVKGRLREGLRLVFTISNKGCFMCTIPQAGKSNNTIVLVTPIVVWFDFEVTHFFFFYLTQRLTIPCSTNFFRRFFLIKSVCRNVETKGKVFWK